MVAHTDTGVRTASIDLTTLSVSVNNSQLNGSVGDGASAWRGQVRYAIDGVSVTYDEIAPTHRTIPAAAVPALVKAVRPILQKYATAVEADRTDEADDAIVDLLAVPQRMLYLQRGARNHARTIRRQIEGGQLRATQQPDKPRDPKAHDAESAAIRLATRTIDAGGQRALHRAAKALAIANNRRVAIDDHTINELKTLHPINDRRPEPLPAEAPPPRIQHGKDYCNGLLKTLRSMCSAAAPGPSGWTEELLYDVMQNEDCIEPFALLIANISQGLVGGHAAHLLRACKLKPIPKPSGIRPIGMGEAMVKLASQLLVRPLTQRTGQQQSVADRCFGDIQFGVSKPGGAEAAAGLLQLLQLSDPNHVVLSLDYQNAFNNRSRHQIARAMYNQQLMSTLWRLFNFLYGTPSSLLVHGADGILRANILSTQGVRQGCVLGSLAFALSMMDACEAAQYISGAKCVAVADDVSFCGTLDQCAKAAEVLTEHPSTTEMVITRRKCQLLVQQRSSYTTRTIHNGTVDIVVTPPRAAREFADNFGCDLQIGAMHILGTAIGDDDGKREQIAAESWVPRNSPYFQTLARPHAEGGFRPHHAYQLLRASAIPRLNYLLRTLPPSVTLGTARWFDAQVQRVLLALLGRSKPISALQRACSELPISGGGLGLRSMVAAAPAAFLGATAQALTYTSAAYKQRPTSAPTLAAVQDALDRLRALNVVHTLEQRSGPTAATTTAQAGSAGGPPGGQLRAQQPSEPAECVNAQHFIDHYERLQPHVVSELHAQRSITARVDNAIHDHIEQYAVADDAKIDGLQQLAVRLEAHARLRSCAGKGASLWLRPVALNKQGVLSSTVFARALRLRIGVSPFDVDVHCICGVTIRDDNYSATHIHSCVALRKIAGDARHNAVRDALARIARNAGTDCVVEYVPQPPVNERRDGGELRTTQLSAGNGDKAAAAADSADGNTSGVDPADDNETKRRQRPDLKIYGSGMELLSDVCITNPSCATYRSAASKRTGHAASLLEKRKTAKYSAIAKREGAQLIPCVIEAYGAFGSAAQRLVATLATHRTQQSADGGAIPAIGYRSWAMAILNAATQRAHSVMVDVAYRHMRLRRQALGQRAQRQPSF